MKMLIRNIALITIVIFANSCKSGNNKNNSMNNDSTKFAYTNHLIHESSPYLLQHAHNPVNWYPWGEEAFEKARNENKLVLVSIGYSACHWCHAMEHESFEDTVTAKIMNEYFVCIKVDREERPDIDQVYMNAVQLMTGSGGWPLNCFTLSDGRPIYGGTYFPNDRWKDVLSQLADGYKKSPDKFKEYAEQLTHGVNKSELVEMNTEKHSFLMNDLNEMVAPWKTSFDSIEGGPGRVPKFPMPNNYEFLLRYYHLTKIKDANGKGDESLLKQILLTLNKMAFGGIYDQLGGGFARYSTDRYWKVPHFEKMLYDNAQLVSLYSEAYTITKDPLYKQIVNETLEWIKREMTSDEGTFYSALDADSEGEEGKYYVWKKNEIEHLLKDKVSLFCDYYRIGKEGLWEHENNILLRKESDETITERHHLTKELLQKEISADKELLLNERSKRIPPGLDDKQLTSWNALMIKGYVDAYNAFGDKQFLDAAIKCSDFILKNIRNYDGGLNHSYKKGKSSINGYLEDYSFMIEAFIALYQSTFDEMYLHHAKELAEYSIKHFYDKESGMFFFTSDIDKALIARKMEINDNVIPASNSSLAKGLYQLGIYFDNKDYKQTALQMLNNVKKDMKGYPSGYSNWGILFTNEIEPYYEVVIVGKDAEALRMELNNYYIPNKIVAGSINESNYPLLENRYVEGSTLIYVCVNNSCKLPVVTVAEAVKLMK
jgi:uncharacterized protein YyaL (SSP411 family)